ncbi:MAG: hypothetical protein OIF32_11050 [Campylobacterales bacterium]|nr:hypothetical protein [Campylobacterales bacterium]
MAKGNENTQRLRYIRVLEKFFYSVVNYLQKADEATKESYNKKVANAKRSLDRVDPVPLYKEELTTLENLVNKIINYAEDEEAEIEDIKTTILQSTNQYEKTINRKKYKKEKHSKKHFDEY